MDEELNFNWIPLVEIADLGPNPLKAQRAAATFGASIEALGPINILTALTLEIDETPFDYGDTDDVL